MFPCLFWFFLLLGHISWVETWRRIGISASNDTVQLTRSKCFGVPSKWVTYHNRTCCEWWIIWISMEAFSTRFIRHFDADSSISHSKIEAWVDRRWTYFWFCVGFLPTTSTISIYQDLYSLNMGNQTTNKNVTVSNCYQISNVKTKIKRIISRVAPQWIYCSFFLFSIILLPLLSILM